MLGWLWQQLSNVTVAENMKRSTLHVIHEEQNLSNSIALMSSVTVGESQNRESGRTQAGSEELLSMGSHRDAKEDPYPWDIIQSNLPRVKEHPDNRISRESNIMAAKTRAGTHHKLPPRATKDFPPRKSSGSFLF